MALHVISVQSVHISRVTTSEITFNGSPASMSDDSANRYVSYSLNSLKRGYIGEH